MIELLDQVIETELQDLMNQPGLWKTLYIDYTPPIVERMWCEWKGHRINLHCIQPCDTPFFHPHPWPCAIRTLAGQQEMAVGYGPGVDEPPVAARMLLGPGSRYEMLDFDAWHSVKVVSPDPMYSIMLTGAPWNREMPRAPKRRFSSLTEEHQAELMAHFARLLW